MTGFLFYFCQENQGIMKYNEISFDFYTEKLYDIKE